MSKKKRKNTLLKDFTILIIHKNMLSYIICIKNSSMWYAVLSEQASLEPLAYTVVTVNIYGVLIYS